MTMRAHVTRQPISRNYARVLLSAFGTDSKPGPILIGARYHVEEKAKAMAQEFRDRIYHQEFRSIAQHPLSKRWIAEKARRGLDPRTFIAQKKYVRAIQAQRTKFGMRVGIIHGYRIDTHVTKSGREVKRRISYKMLQHVLEYGSPSRRIPARAHWRIIMREWKARAVRTRASIKKLTLAQLRALLK